MSTSRPWLKLLLAIVTVACLVGAGWLAYRMYFAPGADKLLAEAEAAYQRGLENKNAASAVVQFHEARLQAKKACERLESDRTAGKIAPDQAPKFQEQLGQAFWIRARAVRDHAFAKAEADGKPLPLTDDSTTGEDFRNFFAIPTKEDRDEATASLRNAAHLLTKNVEVQREVLRLEVQPEPMRWDLVERFADNLVNKLNQNDLRAYYMLARHEFEQHVLQEDPITRQRGFAPLPADKRNRDRVLKARGYLNKLKELETKPFWRTTALEGQMRLWLRNEHIRFKDTAAMQKEDRELRAFLFDETSGALARAAKEQQLDKLNFLDGRGLLTLHVMALELVLEDFRKPKQEDRPTVRQLGELFAALMTTCQRLTAAPNVSKTWLGEVTEQAGFVAQRYQPFLATTVTELWQAQVKTLKELTQRCASEKSVRPKLYYQTAQVLWFDAQREARRGAADGYDLLRKEALGLVEGGLAIAAERKPPFPAENLADLHFLAAEIKMVSGLPLDPVRKEHLTPLRAAKGDRAEALAELLDGNMAFSEGRLDKARASLVIAIDKSKDRDSGLFLQGHLTLAEILLALGRPEDALRSLGVIASRYAALEQQSAPERHWHFEIIHSPADIHAKAIAAHLLYATQQVLSHLREKPGQPVPAPLVAASEKQVDELVRQLPEGSRAHLDARIKLVAYWALTSQWKRADEEMAALNQAFPDSLDVARTDIRLKLHPRTAASPPAPRLDAKTLAEVDARIDRLRTARKQDFWSRLLFAEWLVRSDRAGKAVEFLRDGFPVTEKTDEHYRRLLAQAELARGNRDEAARLISHFASDPARTAFELVMSPSPEHSHKLLDTAIATYRRKGLFQTWDAGLHLQQRKFEEAAKGFLKAAEYGEARALARQGLVQTFLAWTDEDPAKVLSFCKEQRVVHRTDPVLVFGEACAHFRLDDLGDPRDARRQAVGMAGALERFERLLVEEAKDPTRHIDRSTGPLIRAEFWRAAGQPELAAAEVARALQANPKHEAALTLGIAIALEAPHPALLAEARKHLAALKALKPEAAEALRLEARLAEREGNLADARRLYAELIAKHPAAWEGYRRLVLLLEELGSKDEAARMVAQWRARNPEDVFAAQFQVRHLVWEQKLAEARQHADAFIADAVNRAQRQADALKPELGQDAKTLEARKQALVANARRDAEFGMAQAFLRAAAFAEADARLQQVLKDQPGLAQAHLYRAEILLGRKAWPEAKAAYETLYQESPSVAAAAGNNLAWLLAKHLNQPAEAWKIATELRKGRFSQQPLPGNRIGPDVLDTLGVVYRSQNKPELAAEMRDLFEAARKRYPTDPRIYLYLGHAYASLNEVSAAQGMFATAIELAGSKGKVHLSADRRKEVQDEAQAARQKLGAASARP